MKKYALLIICAILGVLFLGMPAIAEESKTRIITDMTGREIEIPETIERVAFFGGPIGQVPYILGVQDTIVATSIGSKNSELLNIIDPNLKNIASPRQTNGIINIEELIKSEPQFVLAGDVDGAIVEKQTTIPVVSANT